MRGKIALALFCICGRALAIPIEDQWRVLAGTSVLPATAVTADFVGLPFERLALGNFVNDQTTVLLSQTEFLSGVPGTIGDASVVASLPGGVIRTNGFMTSELRAGPAVQSVAYGDLLERLEFSLAPGRTAPVRFWFYVTGTGTHDATPFTTLTTEHLLQWGINLYGVPESGVVVPPRVPVATATSDARLAIDSIPCSPGFFTCTRSYSQFLALDFDVINGMQLDVRYSLLTGCSILAVSGSCSYLFGSSAYAGLEVPEGVTWRSGSGVFLSSGLAMPVPVPEPDSMWLAVIGIALLAFATRLSKRVS